MPSNHSGACFRKARPGLPDPITGRLADVAQHVGESLDDLRVKLDAGLFFQVADRFCWGHVDCAIWSAGGQRIIDIDY